MLAISGQASPEYLTDREKLLKHGIMIAKYNSCFFNHLITTGTIYLEPIRLCRLLCNGALDIAEKEYFKKRKPHTLMREKEDCNHGKCR